jgi:hypothetical protein
MARRHPARNDQEGLGMTTRLMKMSVLAEVNLATWTGTPTNLRASSSAAPDLAPVAGEREARGLRSLLRRSVRSA